MRGLPIAFKAAIESGSTSLARVWTITRTDGAIYRFTDHDTDIKIGVNVFRASDSFTMSDITHSVSGVAQAATMAVNLGSNAATHITYEDLTDDVFKNSTLRVDVVLWDDPSIGTANIFNGVFSAVEIDVIKNRATIDITGTLSKGIPSIGQKFSAECRADLGDGRCRVDLSLHTSTGLVTSVTNKRKFEVQLTPKLNNYQFSFGKLIWTSGLNSGLRQEVLVQYGTTPTIDLIITAFYARKDIQVGDTLSITKGCDFRPTTCATKFDNILNFRGEPFIPGPDFISDKAENLDVIASIGPPAPPEGG